MSQNPFVGAPNGAIWGFDPTTSLWLPVGISPKLVAANGEEYGSLLVWVSNANANGQNTMQNSSSVVIASDQTPVRIGFNNFSGGIGFLKSAGNLGFANADNDSLPGITPYLFDGETSGLGFAVQRTPSVFRTVSATATGNTAVWTPATGRRFRLMAYKIEVTQNVVAAAAAVLTIKFQDATTDINLAHSVFIPSAAATTFGPGWSSEWIPLGNGYASSAENNVLNINLSFALTGGNVRVIAIGMEEF